MTRSPKARSLSDEISSTHAGANALAAADLAIQVSRMLYLALTRTGVTQAELASRLGVTEGRVSQVVTGDGNIHIATFGRFMRALGYKIELRAVGVSPDLEPIEPQQPRRTREDRHRAAEAETFSAIVQNFSGRDESTVYPSNARLEMRRPIGGHDTVSFTSTTRTVHVS